MEIKEKKENKKLKICHDDRRYNDKDNGGRDCGTMEKRGIRREEGGRKFSKQYILFA